MTERRRISSPLVPEPPPGTFSRAIQVGNQLFVAGMTANSPSGVEGGDSMYEQTRAVFRKIQALVEAAGGTMNDVVKMTGFITDIRRREEYLRARQPFFTADPPASTLVEITALAAPGLIIEVEVMAIIGSSGRGARRGPMSARAKKTRPRRIARGKARR
ncbi:MAG TPA: RidA family protein [Methylomirabilota bacterium]|jgi:enamine deaminase RidA (YjgF/YER057c/UK114 family)|nr:RidA family protein [Methylomirabilota bacterium]